MRDESNPKGSSCDTSSDYLDVSLWSLSSEDPTSPTSFGLSGSHQFPSSNAISRITNQVTDANIENLFNDFTAFLKKNHDKLFIEEVNRLNKRFEAAKEILNNLLERQDVRLERGLSEFKNAFTELQKAVRKRVSSTNECGQKFFFLPKETAGEKKSQSPKNTV